MNQLTAALNQIAQKFANEIADAIKSASFADVAALNGAAPSQHQAVARAARTPSSLTTARIHAFLTKHGADGLRSENIREHFAADKVGMARALKKALAEGLVKKTGEKRATTYFANKTIDADGGTIENPAAVLATRPEPTPQQSVVRRPKKKSSTVVVIP